MRCRVQKSSICGQMICPANKSYTHRAVFLASLAGGSRIRNALISEDTLSTINACRKLGADISVDGSSIAVESAIDAKSKTGQIDAGNSGTTIRIAAGIASLYGHPVMLTGDFSLQKRPMQPLLDALSSMGVKCLSSCGMPPVTVSGPASGGSVRIPGGVSSQFVSSLLIMAPMTRSGIELAIEGDAVSRPYIDATVSAMRKFGADVKTIIPYRRYMVPSQAYAPAEFTVPADSSSLALLLSAAALGGKEVTIRGSLGDLPQGDDAFIGILEQMGAPIRAGEEFVRVGPCGRLSGGRFDLRNSPDLLPPLSILSLNSSTIDITNVGHARLKETDRIGALSEELEKLGVSVQERDDGMVLNPPLNPKGSHLDSRNDHRLFMALCIAGMFVGDCTVTDPQSVGVSYPEFIGSMNRAGAKISVEQ